MQFVQQTSSYLNSSKQKRKFRSQVLDRELDEADEYELTAKGKEAIKSETAFITPANEPTNTAKALLMAKEMGII